MLFVYDVNVCLIRKGNGDLCVLECRKIKISCSFQELKHNFSVVQFRAW